MILNIALITEPSLLAPALADFRAALLPLLSGPGAPLRASLLKVATVQGMPQPTGEPVNVALQMLFASGADADAFAARADDALIPFLRKHPPQQCLIFRTTLTELPL